MCTFHEKENKHGETESSPQPLKCTDQGIMYTFHEKKCKHGEAESIIQLLKRTDYGAIHTFRQLKCKDRRLIRPLRPLIHTNQSTKCILRTLG